MSCRGTFFPDILYIAAGKIVEKPQWRRVFYESNVQIVFCSNKKKHSFTMNFILTAVATRIKTSFLQSLFEFRSLTETIFDSLFTSPLFPFIWLTLN